MEHIRVISWNIALRESIEEKTAYLMSVIKETTKPTIVAL